jgi:cysteine synthase
MIEKSLISLVGNTPVVELNNLDFLNRCFLKLEYLNPFGSVKDRPVKAIIEGLEKSGKLRKGKTIAEATSGNTGISLSYIANIKSYESIIVMPENMSKERQIIIKNLGSKLILTPKEKGMKGAIETLEEILKDQSIVHLNQFNNIDNVSAHYTYTAEEIIKDFGSGLDVFLTGVGTGGTITGVAKKLKEKFNDIKIIAVEPYESAVLLNEKPSVHGIQGIGAGFIPSILDLSLLDEIIKIKTSEAIDAKNELAKKEGIMSGISTGANIAALKKLKLKDKKILTIACDLGERYLSI